MLLGHEENLGKVTVTDRDKIYEYAFHDALEAYRTAFPKVVNFWKKKARRRMLLLC